MIQCGQKPEVHVSTTSHRNEGGGWVYNRMCARRGKQGREKEGILEGGIQIHAQ